MGEEDAMDERIGSKNNKWKLASDYCPRELLSKHIKYEKLPDLSLPRRLKSIRSSPDLDCFQRNVLGNSYLSNTQVLLALLLQKNPLLEGTASAACYGPDIGVH